MAKKKVDEQARHLELCIEHKNISGLVDFLADETTKGVHQVGAAEGLVALNTDESWAALMEFVRVHEGHSVELVLQAVGPATHTNALKVFREALGNPQVFVRMASTRALTRQGSSASFGILLRASRDPEPGIRSLATRTMVRRVDENPEILTQVRAATVEGVFEFLDSDRLHAASGRRPARGRSFVCGAPARATGWGKTPSRRWRASSRPRKALWPRPAGGRSSRPTNSRSSCFCPWSRAKTRCVGRVRSPSMRPGSTTMPSASCRLS